MTTNYRNTFITIAPDSMLTAANSEPRPGTVAARQLELLRAAPYTLTSDDLLFEVHVSRLDEPPSDRPANDRAANDRAALRFAFESKSRACLRASPLVRSHGWGLHHDAQGRVAAIAIEDPDYVGLTQDPQLKVVPGMRSRRG